jgi:ABC-type iron transport system FetAB permease component
MAANRDEDPVYASRMALILRWRRIANLFCVLLVVYAAIWLAHDGTPSRQAHAPLVWSFLAFIVAAQVAINLLTIRLRK